MSLILEALRKLEREKPSAEKGGFLVVAQSNAERDQSRVALWVASAFILGVGLALGFGLWFGASRTARVREASAQATAAPPQTALGATPASASGAAPVLSASRPASTALSGPATGPASAAGARSGTGSSRATASTPAAAVRTNPPASTSTPIASSPPRGLTHSTPIDGHDSATTASTPAASGRTTLSASSPVAPTSAATSPISSAAPAPAGSAAAAVAHALTAIGEREGRAVAVIDDRLVHEGDEYEGLRVIRIGTDEVEIEVGGKRQILRFQ